MMVLACVFSPSNDIHALHKNFNVVTMPTGDVLLRHF